MKIEAQDPLAARFKSALAAFPSGVVVATMRDADGTLAGSAASSFSSLSLAPPLVLVCLARTARSHARFLAADRFAINILRPEQEPVAMRFASKAEDKFTGLDYAEDRRGVPVLAGNAATLVCATENTFPGGDHTILVGRVLEAQSADDTGGPMVYYRRRFWNLAERAALQPA